MVVAWPNDNCRVWHGRVTTAGCGCCRLTGTVERLEQKVEDLHRKLEEAKKSAENTMGNKKQEKRRTASLAALDRNHDNR